MSAEDSIIARLTAAIEAERQAALAPLLERIAELEARVAALEQGRP